MKLLRFLAVVAALHAAAGTLVAQDGTQVVTITVESVDIVSVGADVAATVKAGGTGSVDTLTSTYSVTTNSTVGRTIKASITEAETAGVSLDALLADPDGAGAATSAGRLTIPVGAVNAVTLASGIVTLDASGLALTYYATATPSAAAGTYNKTVTYTIQ